MMHYSKLITALAKARRASMGPGCAVTVISDAHKGRGYILREGVNAASEQGPVLAQYIDGKVYGLPRMDKWGNA